MSDIKSNVSAALGRIADPAPRTAAITAGFATAASMWTLGYLLHFPAVSTPAAVVGIALLLVQCVGAVLTGSLGPVRASLRTGLIAGLTVGLLNLLVLGSMLFETSEESTESRPSPAIIIAGWLAFSVIIGTGGAMLGAAIWPASPDRSQSRSAWLGRFGLVSALTMLPLLLVGGIVTTSDSGMAVPDWPNTFGTNMFLFPLSRMTGGVYFEHTHRLFGSLIGLTTLMLMLLTLSSASSAKAKRLSIIVFAFVVAQGVLGGLRVTETSRGLALLHGVAAQVVFALLVVLAAMLSARWNNADQPVRSPRVRKLVRMSWATLIIVLIQITLGGLIRHFSGETLSMHTVITHAGWSLVVIGHVFVVSSRIASLPNAPAPLKKIGIALLALVSVQMLLGIVALGIAMMYQNRAEAPTIRLVMGATHQTVGALLLAGVALALTWTKRTLIDDGSAAKNNAAAHTD